MKVILATIVIFAAAMAAMAIGVIFKRRRLRGSCGGSVEKKPDNDTQDYYSCACSKDPNKPSVTNYSLK